MTSAPETSKDSHICLLLPLNPSRPSSSSPLSFVHLPARATCEESVSCIWIGPFGFLLFSGRDAGKFQWARPVNSCPPSSFALLSLCVNVSLPDRISASCHARVHTFPSGSVLILNVSSSARSGFLSSARWPCVGHLSLSSGAAYHCCLAGLYVNPARSHPSASLSPSQPAESSPRPEAGIGCAIHVRMCL